jgi:hypothetical protein
MAQPTGEGGASMAVPSGSGNYPPGSFHGNQAPKLRRQNSSRGSSARRPSVHQSSLRSTFHAQGGGGGSLSKIEQPRKPEGSTAGEERRSTDVQKLKTTNEDRMQSFTVENESFEVPAGHQSTAYDTEHRPSQLTAPARDHSSLDSNEFSPRRSTNPLAMKKSKSFRMVDIDGSGEYNAGAEDHQQKLKKKMSMIHAEAHIARNSINKGLSEKSLHVNDVASPQDEGLAPLRRKTSMFQGGSLALRELSNSYNEQMARHSVVSTFQDVFLHPKSAFRLLWQVCIAISSIVVGIVVPLRVAFFPNSLTSPIVSGLDALFVVEAIYPFFLFVEMDGELYKDQLFIVSRQLRINTLWDVVGIVYPVVVSTYFLDMEVAQLTATMKAVYLISFSLRLVRLRLLYHFIVHVNIYNVAWKLFRISLVFVLAVHFAACGWWIVTNQDETSLHSSTDARFAIHNYQFPFDIIDPDDGVDVECERWMCIKHAYIMCLYWAMMTITSIGLSTTHHHRMLPPHDRPQPPCASMLISVVLSHTLPNSHSP